MYYHYSKKELSFTDLKKISQEEVYFKPKGLWLSYENEWFDWCDKEGFSTCNMNTCNIYSCKIKLDNLYVIKTLDDLITLKNKYNTKYSINWGKLASEYDGILFDNYYSVKKEYMKEYYTRGNDLIWFLGIDVNSACIWNPKNVIIEWNKINRF